MMTCATFGRLLRYVWLKTAHAGLQVNFERW